MDWYQFDARARYNKVSSVELHLYEVCNNGDQFDGVYYSSYIPNETHSASRKRNEDKWSLEKRKLFFDDVQSGIMITEVHVSNTITELLTQ